jgi:uncharacterized protein YraI
MNKIITCLAVALFTIPTYLFAAQSQNLESVLLDAASSGETDIVKSLLDNGANIEVKNDAGATPLIFASAKGQKDVVKLLVERGANVNARTITGITPLIAGASAGNQEIVKLLLERGADVSAKDQQGRTAFSMAEAAGESQVAALLKSAALAKSHARSTGTASASIPNAPPTQPASVQPPVTQFPRAMTAQPPVAQLHTDTIRKADNSSSVTVRSEPSPQGGIMAYLPVGSQVSYSGEAKNGWVKLSGPIANGWIAEKYLASGAAEASVIRVDNPDQCLRVRSGPGVNYDKIGCLPMGAKVKTAGPAQNSWAKITSPMEGWVSAGQIQGPGVFPAKAAGSGAKEAKREWPQTRSYKRQKSEEDSGFSQFEQQQTSTPAQGTTGYSPFGMAGPGGMFRMGPSSFGMGFR